jgi:hypothetical protein
MCRFYGFGLNAVMAMTLRQFVSMFEQIAEVQKMEFGEDKKETSLTGDAGFALAKTLFPHGRSRRR